MFEERPIKDKNKKGESMKERKEDNCMDLHKNHVYTLEVQGPRERVLMHMTAH